jgi:hypothetical protein
LYYEGIMPHDIYQIKVTLLGTEPPIWRRLLAPAVMTLARLHDALQITMGWEDSHLHQYEIAGQQYGVPDPEMYASDKFRPQALITRIEVLTGILQLEDRKAWRTGPARKLIGHAFPLP